jgi:hypothetical protein
VKARLAPYILVASVIAGSRTLAQVRASSVVGSVSVVGVEGGPVVIAGVVLTLTCGDVEPRTEVTDEDGQFRFDEVPEGTCALAGELQSFRSPLRSIAVNAGEPSRVALELSLKTLREEVTVVPSVNSGDGSVASSVDRMTSREMRLAPLANDRFQDALPLVPGVVRGPDGLLNIGGARSNASATTLNGADGADPATGEEAAELPIDAVSAIRVQRTAYAPQFGGALGALTVVETERGGDAWHYQVNDLEPRLRRRAGAFHGIESFTPRVTLGGPIVKGSLEVLQSVQYERTQTRVFSLPALQSDTKLESFESFTRGDWTPGTKDHVSGSVLVSPRRTTFAGLNTFNPQGVTANITTHSLLVTVGEERTIGDRGVFETRVSIRQFDSRIYPSAGPGVMVLAPDANSGSYFNDQDRSSRRFEWRNTYTFTPLGPTHLLGIGGGVRYQTFDGISTNGPVEIVRKNGTRSAEITFTGPGVLGLSESALIGYAQDTWAAAPRLTVLYGARFDFDSLTRDINVAPRASLTIVASGDGRTVVRGGAGLFYQPIPLNIAGFEQFQQRILAQFGSDGRSPLGGPTSMRPGFAGDIQTPRSVVWNVELDREAIRNLFFRIGYRQSDTRFEAIVDPVVIGAAPVVQLRTDGRSRYREGEVTARYRFHGADQIVASYTRSSAFGDLNDYNAFFGNIENPVIAPNERGPVAWDAPNHFIVWSHVSLPYDVTLFPLLDIRTGFPTSTVDEDRNFVGARNEAGRFPTFLSLDTQISKRFRVFGRSATIGLKIFNLTNHFNPRDYQGNLASAAFGGLANGVGRTFRGKWILEF